MKLIFDGTLEGLSTRQDKTIKVVIGTQEMNDEQLAKLFHFRSKFIKVLFSDTAIDQKEVEAVNTLPIKDESNSKSKSQRLRNTLYIQWQQLGSKGDFNDFYAGQMESLIELVKSGTPFTKYKTTDKWCSLSCVVEWAKKKVWKAEKQKMIDKARTRTEWLNLAQVVFNQYINLRDKGQKCISCNCDLTGKKVHASHFLPVGSYPALRFNEDNVFSSCIECNLHKHGNQAEYAIMLPKRIGLDRFNYLLEQRKSVLKLSEVEIKDLIEKYRKKIKELKKD